MSRKVQSKVVEGVELKCQQFAAQKGFHVMVKLIKVLGPVLGAAKGLKLEDDIGKLAPALAGLDSDEASALCRELLHDTFATVQGKSVQLVDDRAIEFAFGGNLKAYLGAVGFAIEVNYGDFFGGLADLVGGPQSEAGTEAKEGESASS